MMHIKRVPIDKLSNHLEETRNIAVVKDGKVIGHYYPRIKEQTTVRTGELNLNNVRPESRESIQALDYMLREMYESKGDD